MQLQKVRGKSVYGDLKNINVLWDGGSTLSFITCKKAKEMNLTSRGSIRLQIVKIGGVIEEIESLKYEIDLIDKYGNDVRFTVMSIAKISTDIVAVNSFVLKKVFKNIDLKQLQRPSSGEVDCLIGYEYFRIRNFRV